MRFTMDNPMIKISKLNEKNPEIFIVVYLWKEVLPYSEIRQGKKTILNVDVATTLIGFRVPR